MRNGQNKRMRGRHQHHHHRKNQNPLTRVYESNGPEVKIRGTASHIAEKYVQLARDAMASGDPVTAENYHQHAEHYFRLIAAAQEQFRQQNPYYRPEGEMRDNHDDALEDGEESSDQPTQIPMQGHPQSGNHQPYPQRDGQPYPPRESQPYGGRDQQQPHHGRPHHQQHPHQQQPHQQHQYNQQHNQQHQPHQPQPQPSNMDGNDGERLPSFITGGAQPQPNFNQNNNHDGQGGDRYQHRRRRRHRGHHRHDMPGGQQGGMSAADAGDDSHPDND